MSLIETVTKPVYNLANVNSSDHPWGVPTTGAFKDYYTSNANYIWNFPNAHQYASYNEVVDLSLWYYNSGSSTIYARVTCICDDLVEFYVDDTKCTFTNNLNNTNNTSTNTGWPNGGYVDLNIPLNYSRFYFKCFNSGGPAGLAVICVAHGTGSVLFLSNAIYSGTIGQWNSSPGNPNTVYNIPNVWGTPTSGDFLTYSSGNPYYMWNTPIAHKYAIANEYLEFKYVYNNTSSITNARVTSICDNYISLFLVNNVEYSFTTSTVWPNGSSVNITLVNGLNTFIFYCYNGGGPASLAVICLSSSNVVLFNSNLASYPSWTVKRPVSSYNYKGYPLNSLIYIKSGSNLSIKNSLESTSFKSTSFINFNNELITLTSGVNPSIVYASPSSILYKVNNIDISSNVIVYYTEITSSCFVTPPVWCNAIRTLLIGAGGGGHFGRESAYIYAGGGGGGGGGGEINYFSANNNGYIQVIPGSTYYISIGYGGLGAPVNGNPANGGKTSIYCNGNELLYANGGGLGGLGGPGGNGYGGYGGTGGAGGVGGDVRYSSISLLGYNGGNGANGSYNAGSYGGTRGNTQIANLSSTDSYSYYGKGGIGGVGAYAGTGNQGYNGNNGLAVLYYFMLDIDPRLPTATGIFTRSNNTYIFTGNGTMTIENKLVRILAVGGGGGGSSQPGGCGGGGGGGVIDIYDLMITTSTTISITIGNGGIIGSFQGTTGGTTSGIFTNGYSSIIAGGGGGGSGGDSNGFPGSSDGGSGGGMGRVGNSRAGGLANKSNNNFANNGGSSSALTEWAASGGGGGAGSAGGNGTTNGTYTTEVAGNGGNGYLSNITGTYLYWGAGGGGGCQQTITDGSKPGKGGLGGGGAGIAGGNYNSSYNGTGGYNVGSNGCGGANTGSGGGGNISNVEGYGSGGSGIFIISVISNPPLTLVKLPTVSNNNFRIINYVNFNGYTGLGTIANGDLVDSLSGGWYTALTNSFPDWTVIPNNNEYGAGNLGSVFSTIADNLAVPAINTYFFIGLNVLSGNLVIYQTIREIRITNFYVCFDWIARNNGTTFNYNPNAATVTVSFKDSTNTNTIFTDTAKILSSNSNFITTWSLWKSNMFTGVFNYSSYNLNIKFNQTSSTAQQFCITNVRFSFT